MSSIDEIGCEATATPARAPASPEADPPPIPAPQMEPPPRRKRALSFVIIQNSTYAAVHRHYPRFILPSSP